MGGFGMLNGSVDRLRSLRDAIQTFEVYLENGETETPSSRGIQSRSTGKAVHPLSCLNKVRVPLFDQNGDSDVTHYQTFELEFSRIVHVRSSEVS